MLFVRLMAHGRALAGDISETSGIFSKNSRIGNVMRPIPIPYKKFPAEPLEQVPSMQQALICHPGPPRSIGKGWDEGFAFIR